MTINVWAGNASGGLPDYTAQMLRQLLGAPWGSSSARPLGARTGIKPSSPATTVTAALGPPLQYTVNPHVGLLDLEASAIGGPYIYSVDAALTGNLNAADATNDRIDLISMQINDPDASDGSSSFAAAPVYTAGTPGTSPSAPAVPNSRCMALAQIRVPKTGGGAPVVTLVAPYQVATGGILPCRSSTEYPSTPYKGQYVYDISLDGLLRFDGTSWVPSYDAWTGGEGVVAGSSPTAKARKIRYSGSFIYTPNAFGQFAIIFPTAFPNGLVSLMFCPGDTSGGLVTTTALPNPTSTLNTGVGLAKNASGGLITSGSIRVNYIAEGW